MALISDLFKTSSVTKRATSQTGIYAQDESGLKFFFQGFKSKAGTVVTEETALSIAAFYLGIRVISESIASLPLNLYKKKKPRGREIQDNHPSQFLVYAEPNPFQTPMQWKEMMLAHCILRGKAASRIVRNNAGEIVRLLPIHPDRIELKLRSSNGQPFFFVEHEIEENGTKRIVKEVLERDEVFWMYGLSLGMKPVSPLEAMRENLGVALATRDYKSAFFNNSAMPSGILKHPAFFANDKEVDEVKAEFDKKFSGDAKFSLMVLQHGIEWQQMGMSNVDAELIKTESFSVIEIARALRIQPGKLMEQSKASKGDAEEETIEHVVDTLRPWVVRFEEACNRSLITKKEHLTGKYFKFTMDALLRGNTEARNKSFTAGRQWGWYSANDVLELEDKNPLPGEQGDIYLIPANMIDARKVNQQEINGNSVPQIEEDGTVKEDDARSGLISILGASLSRIIDRQVKNLSRQLQRQDASGVLDILQKEKEIARQMLERVLPGLSKILGKDISEDLVLDHIRTFILDTQDAESVDAEKEGLIMAEKILEGSL